MRCCARLGLGRSALALVLALAASLLPILPARADPQLVASLSLRVELDGFGGFSGLELDATGTQMTAISDKGGLLQARLQRDAAGTPTGVAITSWTRLRDERGRVMPEWRADAEGLAIDARGRLLISFEGEPSRVWRYDGPDAAALPLPSVEAFSRLQGNSGLEALAIDAGGALYTLPERSGALDRPFPVWRYLNGRWRQVFDIPRRPPHLPVGMDFGPDGALYLLERDFSGFSFSTRIRRFTLRDGRIAGEETLLTTAPGTHMNLEGLAVWADASGAIRLTMIADDNLRTFLTTDLVEYRLPPTP